MATRREAREEAFLDDPSLYPEYHLLVKCWRFQHALKRVFHQYRTAAMLALAACSIGFSGAVAPFSPHNEEGDNGSGNSDGEGNRFDAARWWSFLYNGLALDLLARHFEGAHTAAACMSAMIAIALLVYPLYQLTLAWQTASSTSRTAKDYRARPPNANYLAVILAVALPCVAIWCVAVWGAGHFRWGIASAMSVGLLSACLSLKTVSFAQACYIPRITGANEQQQSSLTFGEYAFFILAAPSLQCEPRFLKTSARRTCHHPNSFTRAMSEFFNAALVFLALHAACSAMVAPAFRVLATAAATRFPAMAAGGTMDAVIEDGERSLWVDPSGWATLAADGRAGFRFFLSPYCSPEGSDGYEVSRCGSDGGMSGTAWGEVAAAAALVMFVFSPMIHFLTFYGFWHCVCVGCAELWGYPDRHFYGPWWLLTDDPGAMFRLWSTPVHRWLSSCIYRPILSLGRSRGNQRIPDGATQTPGEEPLHQQRGHHDAEQNDGRSQKQRNRLRLLALFATFSFSSLVHEAVTFVAMRWTCWPFSSFSLTMGTVVVVVWDSVYPPLAIIGDQGEEKIGRNVGKDKRRGELKIGSEWRGWGAVAYFVGSSGVMLLVVDFLAWQWWRQTLLDD